MATTASPGQIGWVSLGVDGTMAGSVQLEYPGPPCVRAVVDPKTLDVVSLNGAPLIAPINPSPDPMGQAFYTRNPIPTVP